MAFLAVALVLASCQPAFPERPVVPRGKISASSRLIGCDQADERVQLTVSAHLDPSCTYHEGFDITASNVVLDCRGARIEDVDGTRRIGILITAPADVSLRRITVRNCFVRGFLNNLRVTREGFKQLPRGAEYEHGYSDVLIERNHLYSSRAAGSSWTAT